MFTCWLGLSPPDKFLCISQHTGFFKIGVCGYIHAPTLAPFSVNRQRLVCQSWRGGNHGEGKGYRKHVRACGVINPICVIIFIARSGRYFGTAGLRKKKNYSKAMQDPLSGRMKRLTHAISTRPARSTLSAVSATNKEVVPGAPCPVVTALTVLKHTATWKKESRNKTTVMQKSEHNTKDTNR